MTIECQICHGDHPTNLCPPVYEKRIYSGMCVCGHSWEDHHLSMVMNINYLNATGEGEVPEECEFYGFNEMGGLGLNGENHCQRYQDCVTMESDG